MVINALVVIATVSTADSASATVEAVLVFDIGIIVVLPFVDIVVAVSDALAVAADATVLAATVVAASVALALATAAALALTSLFIPSPTALGLLGNRIFHFFLHRIYFFIEHPIVLNFTHEKHLLLNTATFSN